MKRFDSKVVVITGASAGLGRESAIRFAAEGARVVVAARRRGSLEETARLCRAAGGEAFVQPCDVTKEDDVQALAAAAVDRWGRIDVWINNAGVTLFAPLDDAPFEEHRRVIETNVFGPMHGARAVLPVFRRQRHGVMINVGSILSKVGQPWVASYVISKFALRGMSETLRTLLADEPDIHVCTLLPHAIDTPHFQSGANEVGAPAHAVPPMQSPEKVARAMLELAQHPRRELHVPSYAVLGLALRWLFPETTEKLILHAVNRWHFEAAPQEPTTGNLFGPTDEPGAVHGVRPALVSTVRFALWTVSELLLLPVRPTPRPWPASGQAQDLAGDGHAP